MAVLTALVGAMGVAAAAGCGDSSADDTATTSSSTASGSGNTEPAALSGITAEHNKIRAGVSPAPASPIPPLVWDPTIAATAQAYAENCMFQHSGGKYGENIYANTGGGSPIKVVDDWAAEVSGYHYDSNTCDNVCGHYTQVVWADSTKLGCGVANCTANSPFGGSGAWQLWVCNYDPPGNYVGEKPY